MLPYDEAGSGRAVILLHAGVADRTMWREHLEPLAAAGYRTIAPDLPGFGEAHVAPGPQAPWNDVLETINALGVERAALVGNSFGGAVALRVASVAPVAVSALALISTPPPDLQPSPELEAAWEAEEAALERGDVDAAVKAVVGAWTLPDAPSELRERVADMERRALALQSEGAGATEAPDPLEQDPGAVARIDVPALVAAGEREPFADFREGAEALARSLPRARLELIPAAGHLAPLETPAAFRELLLTFLAARDAG
jgi:pimeloyl-ACP methyl ester carboxylesterase